MSRDNERGTRRRGDDDDDDAPRRRDREDDRGGRDRGGREERGGRERGGSSRGGYEYHKRSREDVERRSSMGGAEFDRYLKDDVKQWKPNDGDNTIRPIQAFWDDPKHPGRPAPHYGMDVYVHYGVGPDRQSYLCPAKHDKGPCPICEERERVANDDEEYAKELAPKRRVLFYMIDRDHERDGVQAWASPWTFDRDVSKISVDKRTGEVLAIDHAFEGYDIEFEKKGQGARTEYLGVSVARRSSELGDESWLDYARDNPIPDMLVFYDYDTIARAFGGGGSHKSKRDRDDDDDRNDRRSSRGRDDGREERSSSRRNADDDDAPKSRRSREPEPPALTWDSVHSMTGRELEDLIEQEKLKINPEDAKDDDELADWICEDLKLVQEPSPRRRAEPPADEEDSPREKLRRMREERESGRR